MSTHFLSLINGWIWSNWGSGGPNPCGDSVKKMSTHFLSLINGWIWSNWGLGAQIHVETVLRK